MRRKNNAFPTRDQHNQELMDLAQLVVKTILRVIPEHLITRKKVLRNITHHQVLGQDRHLVLFQDHHQALILLEPGLDHLVGVCQDLQAVEEEVQDLQDQQDLANNHKIRIL